MGILGGSSERARERGSERTRGREMARCSKGEREQRANSSSSFKKRGGPAAEQSIAEQGSTAAAAAIRASCQHHTMYSTCASTDTHTRIVWREKRAASGKYVEVRVCRHRARSGLCWEMSRAIAPYSGSSFVLLRVYVLQVICYKLYKLSRGAAADHSATCILYTF